MKSLGAAYSLCPKESPGFRDLISSTSSLMVSSTSLRAAVSTGEWHVAQRQGNQRGSHPVAGNVNAVRIRAGAAARGFMLEIDLVLVRHNFQAATRWVGWRFRE